MNFVLTDSDRHHLPEILRQMVPSFFTSPEYLQLDETSRAILGLTVAAFTRYAQRVFSENCSPELEASLALIERLSRSKDPEVVNYVYTDIFDNLRGRDEEIQSLVQHFGPKSRENYADWLRRWSGRS
jgi:hypothetical protein